MDMSIEGRLKSVLIAGIDPHQIYRNVALPIARDVHPVKFILSLHRWG